MADDKIVAIGLLTKRDLQCVGDAFTRQIPIPDDDIFADLLQKLDEVEASPLGKGVTLTVTDKD